MLEFFKVGQIVNTQGLRGDLRIYPYTDYKERFEEFDWVYFGEDRQTKYEIEKVRYKKDLVILKIKGINTIEDAERIKGTFLYIPRDHGRTLDEDTYYIADLRGTNVYLEDGSLLGILKDVVQTGANDIYIIKGEDKKEHMIPAVSKFIKEIDLENNKIVVTPIEGLI